MAPPPARRAAAVGSVSSPGDELEPKRNPIWHCRSWKEKLGSKRAENGKCGNLTQVVQYHSTGMHYIDTPKGYRYPQRMVQWMEVRRVEAELRSVMLSRPSASGKPGVYMSFRISRQQTTRRCSTIALGTAETVFNTPTEKHLPKTWTICCELYKATHSILYISSRFPLSPKFSNKVHLLNEPQKLALQKFQGFLKTKFLHLCSIAMLLCK